MIESQISDTFGDDHDRLDMLFATFHEYKNVDFPRAKEAFRDFKARLQRHIIAEERALFPLFEQKTGMHEHGPTAVMRAEHVRIGNYLQALDDKIRRQDLNTEDEERRLGEILKNHNRKEELVLYPTLDILLGPDDKAAAVAAMKAVGKDQLQSCCEAAHG